MGYRKFENKTECLLNGPVCINCGRNELMPLVVVVVSLRALVVVLVHFVWIGVLAFVLPAVRPSWRVAYCGTFLLGTSTYSFAHPRGSP